MDTILPKVAWLIINSKCNLRCRWCYIKGSEYRGVDMSMNMAKRIISFLKELEITDVTLLGGEPILHPQLAGIIRELSNQNIKSWMITNGRKLKDKTFAKSLVDAGIGSVGISIKGADDGQYKELTGSAGYSDAIAGFRNLQEYGIKPSISITWVRDLVPRFDDVLDNLIEQGVVHLGMDFGTPFVLGDKVSIDSILDPKESANLIGKIYRFLADRSGVNFSFYITFPLCLIEEELRNQMIDQKVISTTCHMPSGSAIIFDQVGRVMSCCHMSEQFLGQLDIDFDNRDTFELFWGNGAVSDFRNQCQMYPHDKCSTCKEWLICGGGCIINWTHWSPEDFITGRKEVIL